MYYKDLRIENLPNEIWVDAFGFDGIYQVSNLGRIKSLGRFVNNGKAQRWVKERIRKQPMSKDKRLTCPFSVGGKVYSQNVSALIYLSFNPKCDYNVKTHCIIHIDKNASNNVLSNLRIDTISNSHHINFNKGLLVHLVKNNHQRTLDYQKLTHKICNTCVKKKEIINFEHGRNKCKTCRKEERKIKYKLSKSSI